MKEKKLNSPRVNASIHNIFIPVYIRTLYYIVYRGKLLMITLFRFLQNGLYHPRPPPDATGTFKICHIEIIFNSVSRQTYKNLSSKY